MEKYEVFVSYRRDGGEALACLISERLKQREYSVFYDVESLRAGKFNEKIFQVIDNCTDVIVVLPENGLDRCKNDDDWVRKEVAYAINVKKNIIPIMMRNFEFPKDLSEDINELRNFNGISANMEYFEASFSKLLSMLKSGQELPLEKIKKLTNDESLQKEITECLEDIRTNNSAESKFKLANCYKKLNNSSYNEEVAKLYMQSAELGYAPAQKALGDCYYYGVGVEENIEKAANWYKLSTEHDYAVAQYNLAYCYKYHNEELYLELFKRAAEQGNADSLYELGKYYENNEKYSCAKEYYERASDLGHKKALKKINRKFSKLYWWAKINKKAIDSALMASFIVFLIGGLVALVILSATGVIGK